MRAAVILAIAFAASCADSPAPRLGAASGNPEITTLANNDLASDGQGMRPGFPVANRSIGGGRGEWYAIPARLTDKLPAGALNSDDANGNPPVRADVPVGGGGNDDRCDPNTKACPVESRDAQEPTKHNWSVGKVLWRGFLVLLIIGAIGILHPW